jgi:epsilon-lactone hydrolase
MATQRTRDICAKHFGWLTDADPTMDPAEGLSLMRQRYDEVAPAPPPELGIELAELGGVSGVWFTPPQADDTAVLYLHGGGLVIGSSKSHGDLGARIALASAARTFVADYRLAPESTFPAQLEDAAAMFRALIDGGTDPNRIVIAGDSAGGGLALATTLNLRDQGGPLPAAIVTLSAWTDMTTGGESIEARSHLDPIVTGDVSRQMADTCVPNPEDRTDPLASPVFGNFDGFPPMLMQVGTSEVLYDDTIRVAEAARKAGVDVELHEAEGMVHVYQMLWFDFPEGRRSDREDRRVHQEPNKLTRERRGRVPVLGPR